MSDCYILLTERHEVGTPVDIYLLSVIDWTPQGTLTCWKFTYRWLVCLRQTTINNMCYFQLFHSPFPPFTYLGGAICVCGMLSCRGVDLVWFGSRCMSIRYSVCSFLSDKPFDVSLAVDQLTWTWSLVGCFSPLLLPSLSVLSVCW